MFLTNHNVGEIFGYINAGLNTILFIPQVILIYKTKNTKSISSIYLTLELLSSLTNLGYGIFISSLSIFLCNFFIAYCKFCFYMKEPHTFVY